MEFPNLRTLADVHAGRISLTERSAKSELINTPGHAAFVAEVERSLRVLDAVVLVVSAVGGVQPQARRPARAIRAAGHPLRTLVNRIAPLAAGAETRGCP